LLAHNCSPKSMAMNKSDAKGSYTAGDVVLTTYGVGVIVQKRTDGSFAIRLWRIPGKSVGSAAQAFLQPTTIHRRLPVAPGMITRHSTAANASSPISSVGSSTSSGNQFLVHSYYKDRNVYLVSRLTDSVEIPENKSGEMTSLSQRRSSLLLREAISSTSRKHRLFLEIDTENLSPSVSGKYYPVLETLMLRGDQTAAATGSILQHPTTQRLLSQTGQAVQTGIKNISRQTNTDAKIEDLTAAAKKCVPELDKNMKQIFSMVKDEELTVLLGKCRTRLAQIVQKDLPKATEQTLERTGIRIVQSDGAEAGASLEMSRKAALTALDEFLKSNLDGKSTNELRQDLAKNFSTAFDSLTTAAKSDRNLSEIFETVSERTAAWQEATGRLMRTRSAGLFVEGASRLQARVGTIFNRHQLQWAGEVGSNLTKAFTEGDTALARLKSIALGDAVKARLVEAIEVRSESVGGLDGIIAGALSTIQGHEEDSSGQITQMISLMQGKASSASEASHETLISVLSRRSEYRDIVLLRIEHVLCNLGDHLGDDLSPEAIASVVRGEGGTAAIFEPIAKRAMAQIDQQLCTAETQVTDRTVLVVLQRIRKIMSGELSLSSLMDEAISILNDENVVAAGESLVQHSENILDAIEGVSSNKAINDAIQIAEKAGLTKEAVMKEVERLNMNELLDTAGSAVADEEARHKLLSTATDTALDFVLRILPSMPVPPFEGVRDGLIYNISNLSLEGFRVRKEDIQIELAGMRATRRQSSSRESSGVDDGFDPGQTHEIRPARSMEMTDSEEPLQIDSLSKDVMATELLIVEIRDISAILEDAIWSFEQTYMPYLKGNGKADVKMSNGAIRLQFELRRRLNSETNTMEPVLCLHDRSCSIGEVEMKLQGEGSLTWILNKLAAIFKGPLRDYVVRTIVNVLTNRSGWILQRLNQVLSSYWELILRTAGLDMVS
jgi:hypothetical protein